MPLFFEPKLQIRHNCAILYEVLQNPPRPPMRHDLQGGNTYSGKVTGHSQKRILKACDLLLQRSPKRRIYNPVKGGEHDFRIGFWTLTVADEKMHTAREAYDLCLKPFLRTARRKWGVESYIWKAELQDRGQIHYHLTTNQFVHYQDMRNEWNKLQKAAGWLDGYAKKHKHFNPNSTDVHAVWKVRNLGAYLAKYLSKVEPDKAATIGKVWDCSKDLKEDRFTVTVTSEIEDIINDAIAHGLVKIKRLDRCTIVETSNPVGLLPPSMQRAYHKFISI